MCFLLTLYIYIPPYWNVVCGLLNKKIHKSGKKLVNKSASVCSNRARGLAHSNCQEMCNSHPRLCRYWDALWNGFTLISEKRVCGTKNDKSYLINLLLNTSVAGTKEKTRSRRLQEGWILCGKGRWSLWAWYQCWAAAVVWRMAVFRPGFLDRNPV